MSLTLPARPVDQKATRRETGKGRFNGKAFEREVAESARSFSLYYQKKASGGIRGEGETRFVRAEPYDGYFVVGGLYCPVEMKSARDHGGIQVAVLKEHQEHGLTRVLREGGCPFLVFNMRRFMAGPKSRPQNEAWALPFDRWKALVQEVADAGKKTLPYQWFLDDLRFARIPRLPRNDHHPAIWDLPHGLSAACRLSRRDQYLVLLDMLEGTDWHRSKHVEAVVAK